MLVDVWQISLGGTDEDHTCLEIKAIHATEPPQGQKNESAIYLPQERTWTDHTPIWYP